MPVKKLSIKKGKKGKLVVHKEAPDEVENGTPKLKLNSKSKEAEPPWEEEEIDFEDVAETQVGESVKKKKGFGKKAGKVGLPIEGIVTIKEQDSPEESEQFDVEGAESIVEENKPMANVGYSIARTINLGDFESLKIQVSLHVPSEVDEEEIEGNYNFCKGWVEQKMNEVSAEYVDTDD